MTPREQRLREMARDVIALMQSGPIADVSPERTETIIAGALGSAIDLARKEERHACALQILDMRPHSLRDAAIEAIAEAVRTGGEL